MGTVLDPLKRRVFFRLAIEVMPNHRRAAVAYRTNPSLGEPK